MTQPAMTATPQEDEAWKAASFSAFEVYERRLNQGRTSTPEERAKVMDEALQHAVGILQLDALRAQPPQPATDEYTPIKPYSSTINKVVSQPTGDVGELVERLRAAHDSFSALEGVENDDLVAVLDAASALESADSRTPAPVQISDAMVEAALSAWFASPPSESDQGLMRSMRAALEAALSTEARGG